uniref:Uncharacterized protein n=1 Tax=Arundo donax TaxID=35708 RepID=A0A0A8YBA7_ARUDO
MQVGLTTMRPIHCLACDRNLERDYFFYCLVGGCSSGELEIKLQ